MADDKISDLTPASTPLAGTELVHVEQGGNSRQVSVDNINAAASGVMLKADYDPNDDQIIAVAQGGTNASTASGARTNLGLGTMAVQNAATVAISGGDITGITDLAVADGGTGASTALDARANLGVAIGSDVQAWSTNLDGFAATTVANVQDRANHTGTQDWGTITGTPTTLSGYGITDAATSAQGALADSSLQPGDIGSSVQAHDTSLDDIAGLTPDANKVVGWNTAGTALANLNVRDLGGAVISSLWEPILATTTFVTAWIALKVVGHLSSISQLAALTPDDDAVVYVSDLSGGVGQDGRRGHFRGDTSDLSGTLLGPDISSSAVDDTTDTVTSVDHGLTEGQAMVLTAAANGVSTNTLVYAIRPNTAAISYDAKTTDFTVGQTVTGTSSTATATIDKVVDVESRTSAAGTLGILWLSNVSGTFQDNEPLTDPLGGSATSASAELSIPNTDKFQIAASYADAVAGTQIDLTGTDPMTFKRHFDPRQGFYVTPTADITGASGAWVRQADIIHVDWFGPTRVQPTQGAFGPTMPSDSVQTDNTDAVNCTFDFLRHARNLRNGVWFGPWYYHVNGSINATDIRGVQGDSWSIRMADGGRLCSSAEGEIAVDLSGSRYLARHDFTLSCNHTAPPIVGILDTSGSAARNGTGNGHYYDDNVSGLFDIAALYVDCQEVTKRYGGSFVNGDNSGNAYDAIYTAANDFNVVSAFSPDPLAYHPEERESRGMVQNTIIGASHRADFLGGGSGSNVYLQGCRGITFLDSYFRVVDQSPQIVVARRCHGIKIRTHFEMASNPATHNIRFIDDDSVVNGFDLETPISNCDSRYLQFADDRIVVLGLRYKGPLAVNMFNYTGGSGSRSDYPAIDGLEVINTDPSATGAVNVAETSSIAGANITVRIPAQVNIPSGDENRFDGTIRITQVRRTIHYSAQGTGTISSGSVTLNRNFVLLSGEGGAADVLHTITFSGIKDQEIVEAKMVHDMTVRPALGNIATISGGDVPVVAGAIGRFRYDASASTFVLL